MTHRLKYRWMAVGLVWALVLCLTGWNIHRVDRIQADRGALETLRMDLRFLAANRPAIEEVRLHRSQLTHPAASDDMGFLVVENNLKRLSWDIGLQSLAVKSDTRDPASHVMPITVTAIGTVPAVAGWITAVEDAYPYLVTRRMQLDYEPQTRTGRLQATFDYHYSFSRTEPVS